MPDKANKKPELVVWNEEKGYYQRELTYGSNIGAPKIEHEEVAGWKQTHVNKANKQFKVKYDEIRKDLDKLVQEVNWNQIVYSSQYNFVPVIGEIYHLYVRNDDTMFLSLIDPKEWNMEYIASFTLDSSQKWVRV